jgi:uncharacterized damage-inducible protein DinB
MSTPSNPYGEHVGDADPVDVLRESLDRYRRTCARLSPEVWTRPWRPGKWTPAQIMVHVAQWEMIFGVRLRCALGVPGYVIQPMNQDPLMAIEGQAVDGPTAFAAFEGVRRMHVQFTQALSAADRARTVQHPERGTLTVEDLLVTLAGHGVHHLTQLETLA